MNHRPLVKALIAVAFLALPSAAFAQSAPPTPYPHDRTWQQQNVDPGQVARDRAERDRIERDRIERERLAREQQAVWDRDHRAPAPFYNNGYYNNGYNGGYNGYSVGGFGSAGRNGEISGIVSSFSPFNLFLDRGTHVELHDGTVINPTGIDLQPGQRVSVYGTWNSDGSFRANTINVSGSPRRY